MANPILDKDRYVFLDRPAIEVHNKQDLASRARQIALFERELEKFGIRWKDLAGKMPPKETRNLLLGIAHILLEDEALLDRFLVEKKLPLKRLSILLEEPLFLLQRWQKVLAAYVLLLSSDKYYHLKTYLRYTEATKVHGTPENPPMQATGIALRTYHRKALVLTSQGEFRVLAATGPVGQVVSGEGARIVRFSPKPFFFFLLALLLASAVYYGTTQTVSTTIFFRASGEVQLSFNPLGNLVEYRNLNSRGAQYMEEGHFDQKDMDTVLGELLEQAYIHGHIKEGTEIILLISGNPLPEDAFHSGRFHDRVKSYQLRYKINNDGAFLYLD